MTIREAIRAEQKSMKDRSPKEKISYFLEYHGIKTACILIAVIVVITFIISAVTRKESGYMGVFFGASVQKSAESYMNSFAQAAGIDTDVYELTVQSYPDIQLDAAITQDVYQTMQGFTAMVTANMVDSIAADADLFLYYSYLGYTADLRTVMTQEQLEELGPWLRYIDGELLRQLEESDDSSVDYTQYPDPADPTAMTDPIPVGIDLSGASTEFLKSYTFWVKDPVIGICSTSENTENALAYLQYIFAQTS